MTRSCNLLVSLLFLAPIVSAQEKSDKPDRQSGITWKKTMVEKAFRSEGVAVADVNKDGKIDVLVGDYWYEAPDWKKHEIRKPEDYGDGSAGGRKGYSRSFACWADDVNGDGFPDLIVIGWPGDPCHWYENPKGKTGVHWKEHLLANSACNETPTYVDLFKTGKRVLLMGSRPSGKPGEVCYFQPGKDPTKPWDRTSISGPSKDGKDVPGSFHFYHGLGMGDLNGDGRFDVLVPDGWWEQPQKQEGQAWKWHPTKIGSACADMHVLDVDGDGKADVISSSGHGYGLWWHQQKPGKSGPSFLTHDLFPPPPALAKEPAGFKFNKEEQALYAAVNKIRDQEKRAPLRADAKLCSAARSMSETTLNPIPGRYLYLAGDSATEVIQRFQEGPKGKKAFTPNLAVGVGFAKGKYTLLVADQGHFSLPGQTHALHLVDINGDGLKDLVTGRRFWAHGPKGDVSPSDPAFLYWFEARKSSDGIITFIPHLIDDDSGIGTQFAVQDINGDGIPDIIISNKKGVYVFEQIRMEVAPPKK